MKKKNKQNHSTLSNIFFMLKIMFKVSPWLVIGEIFEQVTGELPSRLIAVIGLKYIIDEVQNGADPKRIIFGIAAMLAVIVVCEIFNNIFYELFAHREREKMDLGIQSLFYEKAAKLDLAKYDDPGFYSDFILSIENTADNLRNVLNLVRGYVEQIISFSAIAAIMFSIDPVCLAIVLVSVVLFIPLGKYTGNLQTKRREAVTEKHRRADYFHGKICRRTWTEHQSVKPAYFHTRKSGREIFRKNVR
jgi:ATP-binding cassette subfamily B protein